MSEERFWKKSWDDGITDLDPKEWETTYTDGIRETFEQYPNQLALEFLGVEITFKELDEYSNQFANMIIENGFKKGDLVGINLPNTPQFIIAWLGTLKAGCAVSGVSPLLSAEQLEYQIKDLGSAGNRVALITLDAIFEHRLKEISSNLPQLKLVIATNITDFLPKIKQVLGKLLKKVPKGKVTPLGGKKVVNFMDILKEYSTELPNVKITPDDLAYIQYTGGTTGPPKGAMLSHRNIVSNMFIFIKWLGWDDMRGKGTLLSGFPFFHIAGIFACENAVYLGWRQLILPNPRDTGYIVKLIKKYKPTVMANVPNLYQMLLKEPKFKELDHSTLKTCISTATPFPKESQEEFESVVGKGKILQLYGITETSPFLTGHPSKGKMKLGSIGLPFPNIDIKLVDLESGEEVSLGEPGEIVVKGPMVMKGYYNKPEETKKVFDDEGYMYTGDVGVIDEEGYIRIVDRTKDMINVSGFKVFSIKVEDILTKHPAIGEVVIIGLPNPERPVSEIVKAYIQIDPDYSYDGNEEALKEDITKFAKEKCNFYEVPEIIEILEEMPLTHVGKVDKKKLQKRVLKFFKESFIHVRRKTWDKIQSILSERKCIIKIINNRFTIRDEDIINIVIKLKRKKIEREPSIAIRDFKYIFFSKIAVEYKIVEDEEDVFGFIVIFNENEYFNLINGTKRIQFLSTCRYIDVSRFNKKLTYDIKFLPQNIPANQNEIELTFNIIKINKALLNRLNITLQNIIREINYEIIQPLISQIQPSINFTYEKKEGIWECIAEEDTISRY